MKFLVLSTRTPAVTEFTGPDGGKTAHYMISCVGLIRGFDISSPRSNDNVGSWWPGIRGWALVMKELIEK